MGVAIFLAWVGVYFNYSGLNGHLARLVLYLPIGEFERAVYET